MIGTLVMPIVRHGASLFAGYLVGQGLIEASMQDTAIGVVVGLSALLASIFDKKKNA